MRKVVIGTHDEGLKRLKTTDVDEPQTVGSKEIKVRVH
jgi:NADPH:quinone reductase-like Zn-dependent oxidoreductase